MSMKRILGTILASQLGGRGRRRRGIGSSMLGGLGYRRRSTLGGKAGLAALGFMAYRAYQDHQRRTGSATAGSATGTSGTTASGAGTGLGDMVKDLTSRLAGSGDTDRADQEAVSPEADAREARLADEVSDDKALLLIRAMITAAYSDGALSHEERSRIMGEIDAADGTAEDRAVMEREIANPRSLDDLLADVNDPETAEQVYLASRAAVDGESEANRRYLNDLRDRLGLTIEQTADIDEFAA